MGWASRKLQVTLWLLGSLLRCSDHQVSELNSLERSIKYSQEGLNSEHCSPIVLHRAWFTAVFLRCSLIFKPQIASIESSFQHHDLISQQARAEKLIRLAKLTTGLDDAFDCVKCSLGMAKGADEWSLNFYPRYLVIEKLKLHWYASNIKESERKNPLMILSKGLAAVIFHSLESFISARLRPKFGKALMTSPLSTMNDTSTSYLEECVSQLFSLWEPEVVAAHLKQMQDIVDGLVTIEKLSVEILLSDVEGLEEEFIEEAQKHVMEVAERATNKVFPSRNVHDSKFLF